MDVTGRRDRVRAGAGESGGKAEAVQGQNRAEQDRTGQGTVVIRYGHGRCRAGTQQGRGRDRQYQGMAEHGKDGAGTVQGQHGQDRDSAGQGKVNLLLDAK